MKFDEEFQRKAAAFEVKQKMPYDFKKRYAAIRAREFAAECEKRLLNYFVSVGGLDSITLFLFLKSLHIDAPGVSVSYLEDVSIQKVHRQLGIQSLKPLVKEVKDGKTIYWTQDEVIREFGFPVISKQCAVIIQAFQNKKDKNKHMRERAVESGRILTNRWRELFAETEAPFRVSEKCCEYIKEKPMNKYCKETNSVPYLGLMASEGGRREKSLKANGCNYFGKRTIRSCPFAIFQRDDLLRLARELDVPVPAIYGEIRENKDGTLYTTGAQRTGCAACGFGIHLEGRPHRFDRIRQKNPHLWEHLMYHLVQDDDGTWYGWGRVLDYIGVGWRDEPPIQCEQIGLTNFEEEDLE